MNSSEKDPIDLIVGVYGWADTVDAQVTTLINSLHTKCNLVGVSVYFVERTVHPVSKLLAWFDP